MQLIDRLVEWDSNILSLVLRQREKAMLTPLAKTISHSGDGYLQVLCIGIAFSSATPLATGFAITLCKLFVVERICYFLLKNILKRKRPADKNATVAALVRASDKFSFPSGHTSAAFILAASATAAVPMLGLVFIPWAICVGFSRVFLGVHYPSDILAGMALALALFLAI